MTHETETPSPSQTGLALASLVLGILGFFSSLFLVGALFGLLGLTLGAVHLSRRQAGNSLAWVGIVLSVMGIAASLGFGFFYYPAVTKTVASIREAQQRNRELMNHWEGVRAPDLSMTTLDGQTIKLSELKGKRVVLDFWATWCPPCVMEIPHLIRLREQNPENELIIIGISSEDSATLQAFVKRKQINYPIASAAHPVSPYKDVNAIPTTFFIDRHGVIQRIAMGYHEYDELKDLALATDYEGQPKPAPAAPGSGSSDRTPQ